MKILYLGLDCSNEVPQAQWVKSKRNFISRSSGGWKSELGLPAWAGPGEGSRPRCMLPAPRGVCLWWEAEMDSELSHDSSEGPDPIREGPLS